MVVHVHWLPRSTERRDPDLRVLTALHLPPRSPLTSPWSLATAPRNGAPCTPSASAIPAQAPGAGVAALYPPVRQGPQDTHHCSCAHLPPQTLCVGSPPMAVCSPGCQPLLSLPEGHVPLLPRCGGKLCLDEGRSFPTSGEWAGAPKRASLKLLLRLCKNSVLPVFTVNFNHLFWSPKWPSLRGATNTHS